MPERPPVRIPFPIPATWRPPEEVQRGLEQRVDIDVAGVPVAFVSDLAFVASSLRQAFAPSLRSSPDPRASVTRVEFAEGPYHTADQPSFVIEPDRYIIDTGGAHGEYDRGSRRGVLRTYWAADTGTAMLERTIENYMRMLTAVELLDRDAMLLHSAGVIREGRGYAFFGPSEIGKSTTAETSANLGYKVLSDDLTCVMVEGDKVILQGVPYKGGYWPIETVIDHAPLEALLYLQQADSDYLESVPYPRAVSMLAAQAPFVNYQPELMGRLLDVCSKIASRIPVRILHKRKGPDFWKLLEPATSSADHR